MSRLSNRTTWKPRSARAAQKSSGQWIIWLPRPMTSRSVRVRRVAERVVADLDPVGWRRCGMAAIVFGIDRAVKSRGTPAARRTAPHRYRAGNDRVRGAHRGTGHDRRRAAAICGRAPSSWASTPCRCGTTSTRRTCRSPALPRGGGHPHGAGVRHVDRALRLPRLLRRLPAPGHPGQGGDDHRPAVGRPGRDRARRRLGRGRVRRLRIPVPADRSASRPAGRDRGRGPGPAARRGDRPRR